MTQKSRTYISDESRNRLNKYVQNQNLSVIKRSPVTDALDVIIQNAIDKNGEPVDGILLTEQQHNIIKVIAGELGQTTVQTTQDLINYALLVYGTDISLRDLLYRAAPLMMDSLVKSNPEIAKGILNGLKSQRTLKE
jgi:hypothetical protein